MLFGMEIFSVLFCSSSPLTTLLDFILLLELFVNKSVSSKLNWEKKSNIFHPFHQVFKTYNPGAVTTHLEFLGATEV